MGTSKEASRGRCLVAMDDGTECGRDLSTPRFCAMHYQRDKRGTPMGRPARRYVEQEESCPVVSDDGATCGRPTHAHNMCLWHWARNRDGLPLGAPLSEAAQQCLVCNDGTPAIAKGLCQGHYQRHRDGRDMHAPLVKKGISDDEKVARILAAATPNDDGCLIADRIGSNGYATAVKDSNGKGIATHRLVYRVKVGPIPNGEQIHHKCGETTCVNPDHLEAATQQQNMAEMHARRAYEARIAHLEATNRGLEDELTDLRIRFAGLQDELERAEVYA